MWRSPLPLLLLLLLLMASCSHPEGLYIGEVELPWNEVSTATEELHQAFPQYGTATLEQHLLLFGMGKAALLHAENPELSAAARQQAEASAKRLRAGEDFAELHQEWAASQGREPVSDGFAQPNPAALGSRVAAKVATLEPGEWAGPLRTSEGWELIGLRDRAPGARHRANVDLYRLVYPVGGPEAHARAAEEWATLPLHGNRELILALPLEFRLGRTPTSP